MSYTMESQDTYTTVRCFTVKNTTQVLAVHWHWNKWEGDSPNMIASKSLARVTAEYLEENSKQSDQWLVGVMSVTCRVRPLPRDG